MFTATFTAFVIAAISVSATPTKRAPPAGINDTVILNYALTLEHLESAFYSQALARFDNAAFTNAGLPSTARARFAQVAAHEVAHVNFLSAALGDDATAACEYNFPYNDPASFAALAQALEGVGVSAYAGAAQYITNPAYLTAAAAVLSTEARHAAYVASAVNRQMPWSGPLDAPLGINQVYTLAAQFITSCPSSNPTLPVKAFPAFTLATGTAGSEVAVTYNTSLTNASPLYVAFYTGLSPLFAELKDGRVTIPKDLVGTAYAVLSTNGTVVSDESTVAGVAIVNVADDVATPTGASTAAATSASNGALSGRSTIGVIGAGLMMVGATLWVL